MEAVSVCGPARCPTSRTVFIALFAALVVLLTSLATVESAVVLVRRSVAEETDSSENNMSPKKTCHLRTPCGWAVYIPFTRRVDYFMKNTCDCPKETSCLRTDDDLSVSAYVYRCKVESSQVTEPTTQSQRIS